jgi:N-acyl amino acid synthase FeeM
MKFGAEPRTPLVVRGAGLFERIDYRLIETPEDKDLIYAMRYRAYLHGNLIAPTEAQRVTDRYDDAPNAWIFGIYVDGELCSSIRIHVLTSEWRTSFSTEFFGDVLNRRLDRGEIFVDPARFAADPEKAQRFPELPYLTVRLGYLACDHFNADTGLALVRPDHQAFYRRVLLSETISEPRVFTSFSGSKTVVLMASDFWTVREKILTRFPIMRSNAFERRMLFDRGGQHKAAPRPVLVSAPLSPDAAAPLI